LISSPNLKALPFKISDIFSSLIFESPEAVEGIEEGDIVEINQETGVIKNLTKGTEFKANPIPPDIRKIMEAGGLMEYAKQKLGLK